MLPDRASILKGLDLLAGANSELVRSDATIKGGFLIFQCVAGQQQVLNLRSHPLARKAQQDQCAHEFRLKTALEDKNNRLILAVIGGQ
jgi:hypothetical protein